MMLRFETGAPKVKFCTCVPSKIREVEVGVSIDQLNALPRDVMDSRYVAPFRNQRASKATSVENRGYRG